MTDCVRNFVLCLAFALACHVIVIAAMALLQPAARAARLQLDQAALVLAALLRAQPRRSRTWQPREVEEQACLSATSGRERRTARRLTHLHPHERSAAADGGRRGRGGQATDEEGGVDTKKHKCDDDTLLLTVGGGGR